MSVESCAQAVSNLAIQFGDSDDDGAAMSRPFGVAILFAGIDEKGPQLYHMDPSGEYFSLLEAGYFSISCSFMTRGNHPKFSDIRTMTLLYLIYLFKNTMNQT